MKVELASAGIELPRNEGQVLVARFRNAFERLSSRIEVLHVSLADVNGPRGGRDKLCMIRIDLAGRRQIIVRETGATFAKAIGRAIRRARALAAYELKRRSRVERRPLVLEHVEVRP